MENGINIGMHYYFGTGLEGSLRRYSTKAYMLGRIGFLGLLQRSHTDITASWERPIMAGCVYWKF